MTPSDHRALVERLRFYAGRGGTPISDAFLDAADLIKSLLAERDSFEALWRSTMDVLEAERAERDAAVLAEREACAKECENFDDDGGAGEAWASRFAAAIRARGSSDGQG